MTNTTDTKPEAPMYGNYTTPKGFGIGRFGLITGIGAVGGFILAFIAGLILQSLWASLIIFLLTIALVTPALLPGSDGRHAYARWGARRAYKRNRKKGRHLYLPSVQGPPTAVICGEPNRLPGLLHDSQLMAVDDGHGGVFGAIYIPATGHIAVPILCDPEGNELVDQSTVNTWVDAYGGLLAELGHEPNLVGASVTIETSPDDGSRLRKETERFTGPHAKDLTRAVMAEVADDWPATADDVRAWVTITWAVPTSSNNAEENRSALLEQIIDRLPALREGIAHTGGGDAAAMSPDDISALVASAYSPSDKGAGQLRVDGQSASIPWEDAGPSAGEEREDHLIFDDHASMVLKMTTPPNSPVTSKVMESLLKAHKNIERKRITFLYRPHPVHEAGKIADDDVLNSKTRATTRKDEVRADRKAAYDRAKLVAQDVAAGAGLTRFAMLATATVPLTANLNTTATLTKQLGMISRVQLHVCHHTQAAGFAAGLGMGIILAEHTRVPQALRDNL